MENSYSFYLLTGVERTLAICWPVSRPKIYSRSFRRVIVQLALTIESNKCFVS